MSDGISLAAEAPVVFTDDDLQRARLAVCGYAESATEARMFMEMLGL